MSFVSNAMGISNGYNAQSAAGPGGQITYDPNLVANAQAANTNYKNVNANQAALAQQLLAQSQGQGPNLANLQLQQATNQNNQQAAAAAASQRGMNPALAQRLVMQQQAMNNQNAAGQAGVLRAQQQLAAQQGLAGVYGQQGTEANANVAANESALGNQNNAVTSAVNSANQANAQIAQNNANQSAGIFSGITNAVGGGALSSILHEGGEVERPEKHLEKLLISIGDKVKPVHLSGGGSALMPSSVPQNAIDPGLANGPSDSANNLFGAANLQGGSPMSGASSMQGQDDSEFGGSSIGSSGASGLPGAASSNPLSGMMGGGEGGGGLGLLALAASSGAEIPAYGQGGGIMSMLPMLAMLAAKGGKIPVALSPGELKIPAHKVEAVASGKEKASEAGERIPGKAKVKGDSLKNDTYMTHANAGDIIVKRTKAQNDKDAREFLLAIKADKEKKSGPSGYAKVLMAKRKNA
jgi:hypothetical protein